MRVCRLLVRALSIVWVLLLAGCPPASPVTKVHTQEEPSTTAPPAADSREPQEHEPQVRKPLPSPEEIAQLPPDGGPEFNRLIHETSPYLRQHARNPVDWFPWGPEAFERARREDKPIFLSVGYSTCHWCHVMEHESFENEQIAAVMNELYVCIKVDREERPDLDEIYMNATQALRGRGGWPNSLWLTPDSRPWYAGTYFPPFDAPGRSGFKTVLTELHKIWSNERERVEGVADQLADSIRQTAGRDDFRLTGSLERSIVDEVITNLRQRFDAQEGGFGGAPKFPPHHNLRLLLYEIERLGDATASAPQLEMLTRTLDGMSQGGIHDHVGGGFHRYSTDAVWLLPHFEKMLYDNGLLAWAYVEAFRVTGDDAYRRTAEDILDWALQEMADPAGGFFSAYDADSEGVEGKFYVWTKKEILTLLGEDDGETFCTLYAIRPEGNFREESTGEDTGLNIPHRRTTWAESAKALDRDEAELRAAATAWQKTLYAHRAERVWPHLDDKVLSSWNGLMLSGMARAGRVLGSDRYLDAARKAATFLLTRMRDEQGHLRRSYRAGEVKLTAMLDDYAFVADGLLELADATGEPRWTAAARELIDIVLNEYAAPNGGFFLTPEDHEALLVRSKDPIDKAIPSGQGVLARVLVRLGAAEDGERYRSAAMGQFREYGGLMAQAPGAVTSLILAYAMFLDGGGAPISGVEATASSDADAAEAKPPVLAEAYVSRRAVTPGGEILFAVRLVIDKGWHVNSPEPHQDYLVPTRLSLSGATVERLEYPQPKDVQLSLDPAPLSVYEGEVWLTGKAKVGEEAGEQPLELNLEYQACDDSSCQLAVKMTLRVPLEIRAESGDEVRHAELFERLGLRD